MTEKNRMYNGQEVVGYTYEGADYMLGDVLIANVTKPPAVHKDFKASLRLKNGKVVPAPNGWRKEIWEWWFNARKSQIVKNILGQASKSIMRRN